MNWYPWLNSYYKKLISCFQKKYKKNSLLLFSDYGVGSESIVYAIGRWLVCNNRNGVKSCKTCKNCYLSISKTYPHWYNIDGNSSYLNISYVRSLIGKLHFFSHNMNKVICVYNTENVRESILHILIKMIDKLFVNTYFLFDSHNMNDLVSLVRSRSLFLSLKRPKKKFIISFLKRVKKKEVSSLDIKMAVDLYSGSPVYAFLFLERNKLKDRLRFFNILNEKILHRDVLSLYFELLKDTHEKVCWMISILLDTVKFLCNIKDITNYDQTNLIKNLKNLSFSSLYKMICSLISFKKEVALDFYKNQEVMIFDKLLLFNFLCFKEIF
ncbi:hypothetical protein AOQ88_01445 [Candidatus Riesia sp. GBBU]|nr:hypothetical protein AOQ88_01445 [Candidatus Riesia sp. GBBU]